MPKKIEVIRGRRTGLKLKAPTTQDVDEFWETVQTSDTPSPKEQPKKEKPIKYPDALHNQNKKPSRGVLDILEKLHNDDKSTTSDFLSPSNLSRVSTAPPSASSKDDMVLSDDDEQPLGVQPCNPDDEDLFPEDENDDEDEMGKAASLLPSPPSQPSDIVDLEDDVEDLLNNTSGYSPDSNKLMTQQEEQVYSEDDYSKQSKKSPKSSTVHTTSSIEQTEHTEDHQTVASKATKNTTSTDDDTIDRSHEVIQQRLASPPSLKTSLSSRQLDNDLQYSDDDKEGEGFHVAHNDEDHDEETPPKKKKRTKKVGTKKKFITPSPSNRRVTFSSGYQVDNRGYELQPISSFVDSPDRDDGVRRSKRARMKPLQFWKNERLVYSGKERIPVVTGVLTALPTPYKKRKINDDDDEPKPTKIKKQSNYTDDTNIPIFDDTKLRQKNDIMDKDADTGLVIDPSTYEIGSKKLIAYSTKLQSTQLPITGTRSKKESKVVGKAAQAFNLPPTSSNDQVQLPGWISGHLHLPPKGIKDAEGVGNCAQVFFIQSCQPNALEVAYGDPEDDEFTLENAQRFLVNPGDFFHIPPGNIYRIENHSKEYESKLAWTIIRPFS